MSSKLFKIKYGFEKTEFIPIDETELAKAYYVHLTGKNGVFKNGSISGNRIIAILPDLDKAEKVYNPAGEDYLLPKTKSEYDLVMDNARETATAKIENRAPQLKSPSVRIHTQGMQSIADNLTGR